nr:hypothetical protein CFP56_04120 [Quercus suber]
MPWAANDPLDIYMKSGGQDVASTSRSLEMYRLLLPQPQRDIDNFVQAISNCSWWRTCPDVSCMKLIRNAFSLIFDRLPWSVQIELAINACLRTVNMTPKVLLETLDYRLVDAYVAEAKDDLGCTFLHQIAMVAVLTPQLSIYISAWADLVRQLITSGANLYAKDDRGLTPLTVALSCQSLSPINSLYRWAHLLKLAGVDLDSYGRTEMAVWNTSRPLLCLLHHHHIRWTFGRGPEAWTIKRHLQCAVPVYQHERCPGAWPESDERTARVISWEPDDEDTLEVSWQWRMTHKVSMSLTSSTASMDHPAVDETVFVVPDEARDPRDDYGFVEELIRKSFKPHQRPRSCSLPAISRRTYVISDDKSHSHGWLPPCHVCVFDGKLKYGRLVDCARHHKDKKFRTTTRKCAKGDHDFELQDLWTCSGGIDVQMRSFRRRYRDLDELRGLPYAAYHAKWWRNTSR